MIKFKAGSLRKISLVMDERAGELVKADRDRVLGFTRPSPAKITTEVCHQFFRVTSRLHCYTHSKATHRDNPLSMHYRFLSGQEIHRPVSICDIRLSLSSYPS